MKRLFPFTLGLASTAFVLQTHSLLPSLDLSGRLQPGGPALAQFKQEEVNQENFVLIASPVGNTGNYQLLIVEQISAQKRCWAESGANPVLIDPLLLQFDFTRICSRSTDSNGYSIRMAGRDIGFMYSLSVVKRNNDLLLLGTSTSGDRKAPVLEIGRTNGLPPAGQFAKITLNPGWRLTRRILNDRALGHIYLTTDTAVAGINLPNDTFFDTRKHWARDYIEALVSRGIITGFPDGTFRPDAPVTRVQYAIIVSKAFPDVPASRPAPTFKDNPSTFWAYQAIQTAAQQGFISGFPDGTFKQGDPVTKLQVLLALSSGLNLGNANPNLLSFYQDAAQIPSWATNAVATTTAQRIVVNHPDVRLLTPDRPATRAEVAAIVYQALASQGKVQPINSPYVVPANP